MEMADQDGLEVVTIRRLAQELGVTPMALYWHFADKDALLMAISERLWVDIARAVDQMPSGHGWGEVRNLTAAVVDVLSRHPGCASLAPLAVLACPAGTDMTERTLTLLEHLGVPSDRLPEMAVFLLTTAITLVTNRPGGTVGEGASDDHLRAKRVALASLPPERYPHVVAMAAQLVDCQDVEGFLERGVDFVVGGIRSGVASAKKK
jgi:TetR/AcrR family tetracycline transcriptional repressor